MYELLDTVEETAGEKDEKHCTTSKMLKSATMYTHLKEHNHTKMVSETTKEIKDFFLGINCILYINYTGHYW